MPLASKSPTVDWTGIICQACVSNDLTVGFGATCNQTRHESEKRLIGRVKRWRWGELPKNEVDDKDSHFANHPIPRRY
jgi:hypothetical protein